MMHSIDIVLWTLEENQMVVSGIEDDVVGWMVGGRCFHRVGFRMVCVCVCVCVCVYVCVCVCVCVCLLSSVDTPLHASLCHAQSNIPWRPACALRLVLYW